MPSSCASVASKSADFAVPSMELEAYTSTLALSVEFVKRRQNLRVEVMVAFGNHINWICVNMWV